MKSSSELRANRAPYLAAAVFAAVIAFTGLVPGLALAEDASGAPGSKITGGSLHRGRDKLRDIAASFFAATDRAPHYARCGIVDPPRHAAACRG